MVYQAVRSVSGVVCTSCQRWEIRGKSGVPDDFVCRLCVQLQIPEDHMGQLELQGRLTVVDKQGYRQ